MKSDLPDYADALAEALRGLEPIGESQRVELSEAAGVKLLVSHDQLQIEDSPVELIAEPLRAR